ITNSNFVALTTGKSVGPGAARFAVLVAQDAEPFGPKFTARAGDEAGLHRVGGSFEDDRNGRARRPCGARRERPRGCRAAEQRYERAALHSITSSAMASTPGGTVRPSAPAVFMLMTSSNLVGCSTGRSAGFSPFRIRPARMPIWRYASARL